MTLHAAVLQQVVSCLLKRHHHHDSSLESDNDPSWVPDWTYTATSISKGDIYTSERPTDILANSGDFPSDVILSADDSQPNESHFNLGRFPIVKSRVQRQTRTLITSGFVVDTAKIAASNCIFYKSMDRSLRKIASFWDNYVNAGESTKGRQVIAAVDLVKVLLRDSLHLESLESAFETKALLEFLIEALPSGYLQSVIGDVNGDYQTLFHPSIVQFASFYRVYKQRNDLKQSLPSIWKDRRLFSSASGCLGVGPPPVQVGDKLVLLCDTGFPVLLRRYKGFYRFVGNAYVPSIMEASEEGKRWKWKPVVLHSVETFNIR